MNQEIKLIGGLEGVQIHPLDAESMSKLQENTNTFANSLIQSALSGSVFGPHQKEVKKIDISSNHCRVMSNHQAIKFFGITKEDIAIAKKFTQ